MLITFISPKRMTRPSVTSSRASMKLAASRATISRGAIGEGLHAQVALEQPALVAQPGARGRVHDSPVFDEQAAGGNRKSTRLNSSHSQISYAVFCLKKKQLR